MNIFIFIPYFEPCCQSWLKRRQTMPEWSQEIKANFLFVSNQNNTSVSTRQKLNAVRTAHVLYTGKRVIWIANFGWGIRQKLDKTRKNYEFIFWVSTHPKHLSLFEEHGVTIFSVCSQLTVFPWWPDLSFLNRLSRYEFFILLKKAGHSGACSLYSIGKQCVSLRCS